MPRRSPSLQAPIPSEDITGILPAPTAVQEQATRLLAHAQHLLAQIVARQQALERCLAVLQHAKPRAYFRYTLDPIAGGDRITSTSFPLSSWPRSSRPATATRPFALTLY